jgi:uncharacterized membrane protein YebE (DUF533 family)
MTEPEPGQRVLQAAIAQKVLHAWAQNRQQVLMPLTLNLARLEEAERALLLGMMQAALAARGHQEDAAERLSAALRRVQGEPVEVTPPPDLFRLVAEIEARRIGPHAYAAAALVLDRRAAMERAFLDWLAARLGLSAALVAGLSRTYRR